MRSQRQRSGHDISRHLRVVPSCFRLAYVSAKKTTQTLDALSSQETYEDLEKLRKARAR